MIADLEIHLEFINYTTIESNWNGTISCDPYWRLYINNNDGAGLLLPEGRYALTRNRVHLVPAFLRFGLSNTATVRHFYFHFSIVGLTSSVQKRLFNRPFTLAQTIDFNGLSESVICAGDELTRLCRAKSIIYQSLAEAITMLDDESRRQLVNACRARSRFAAVLDHIETHLAQPLPNEELATIAHMSPSHFAMCFRRDLGESPAQYVMHRRLSFAARQLLFADDPIDAIAEQAGFANRFHFSRQFARHMGISPAAYRKTAPL